MALSPDPNTHADLAALIERAKRGDAAAGASVRSDGDRSITIVYTPLHGTRNRRMRMAEAIESRKPRSILPYPALTWVSIHDPTQAVEWTREVVKMEQYRGHVSSRPRLRAR